MTMPGAINLKMIADLNVINCARHWWRIYVQNLGKFGEIARRVYDNGWPGQAERAANVITELWNALEILDGPAAVSTLNRVWFNAPDRREIYKWPGFNELCDLCSESWALDVDPINVWRRQIHLDPFQRCRAFELASLIDESMVIAGGAVRDYVLRGLPANDIDVFTADTSAPDRVSNSLNEFDTTTIAPESSGNGAICVVRKRLTSVVAGTTKLQVIVIDGSPIAWVNAFDAPCNMFSVDSFGNVYSHHEYALYDIYHNLYIQNEIAQASDERLAKRAAKFVERGWNPTSSFEAFQRRMERIV